MGEQPAAAHLSDFPSVRLVNGQTGIGTQVPRLLAIIYFDSLKAEGARDAYVTVLVVHLGRK